MAQIAQICLRLLIALTMFLAGWIAGNWNKRKEIEKAVKKAISETQKVQKEALSKLKEEYEEKLRRKDKIIAQLKEIINRLLEKLNEKDSTGFSASLTAPGMKLTNVLYAQLNKLNSMN